MNWRGHIVAKYNHGNIDLMKRKHYKKSLLVRYSCTIHRKSRERYNYIGPPRCNWINTRGGNLITRRIRENESRRYPIFVRAHIHTSTTTKIWVKTFGNRSHALRCVRPAIYRQKHLIIRGCILGLFPAESMSQADVYTIPSDRQRDIGFLK